jgi:hypothetical protein
MSKDLNGYVLYAEGSSVPVVCERPDWKKCPDHKHLNESPSGTAGSGFDAELVEASSADLVDDPDDDIISVNEYHGAQSFNGTADYAEDVKVNRFITHANESKLSTAINIGAGVVGGPLMATAIQFGAFIPAVGIGALVVGGAYFLHKKLDEAVDRQLEAKFKNRKV